MGNFNFLDGMLFADDKPNKKCPEKNLEGLAIRIYENGELIPSKDLCNEFNLEYGEGTNGVDMFLSHQWGAYPKEQPNFLIFTPVSRTESKISLFNRDKESSIMESKHKAPWLVEYIKTLVPTAFQGPDSNGSVMKRHRYVDLTIEKSKPITTENNIYYVPKLVERGKDKGKETYVKREHLTLYPVNMPRPVPEAIVTTDRGTWTQAEISRQISEIFYPAFVGTAEGNSVPVGEGMMRAIDTYGVQTTYTAQPTAQSLTSAVQEVQESIEEGYEEYDSESGDWD